MFKKIWELVLRYLMIKKFAIAIADNKISVMFLLVFEIIIG